MEQQSFAADLFILKLETFEAVILTEYKLNLFQFIKASKQLEALLKDALISSPEWDSFFLESFLLHLIYYLFLHLLQQAEIH